MAVGVRGVLRGEAMYLEDLRKPVCKIPNRPHGRAVLHL